MLLEDNQHKSKHKLVFVETFAQLRLVLVIIAFFGSQFSVLTTRLLYSKVVVKKACCVTEAARAWVLNCQLVVDKQTPSPLTHKGPHLTILRSPSNFAKFWPTELKMFIRIFWRH